MTQSKLILPFPDASHSFTNGVEFGRLLHKMESGEDAVHDCGFPVHLENKSVIESACRQFGHVPIFGQVHFDEWIEFVAVKKVSNEN